MIHQTSSIISDVPSFPSGIRSSSIPPPETKDEWLRRESIAVWPAPMVEQEVVSAESFANTMDSVENIERDLKSYAKYDTNFLDNVSKKLTELETNVSYLSDFFLSEMKRPAGKPSTSGGLSNLPKYAFLEQLFDANTIEKTATAETVKKDEGEEKRIAENVAFPGISSELLTVPLPYQLEALQILDLVTKSQKFPKSLIKAWKRSYYSEASIAVFQNGFWWICMEKYKPDAKLQAELFNQLAESFLVLVINVSQKHKDEIFKWYPSCLAQAIYSTFCHSFPDSHHMFTDDFRQYIASTILEWTMGIRSSLCSWKQWPLEALDPYIHTSSKQDEKALSLSTSAEKDFLQTLKREASPQTSTAVRFKSPSKRQETAVNISKVPEDQFVQSHTIGPGATFERVRFNITGRSPLIQHYMSVHHLIDSSSTSYRMGPSLTRTEIKTLPPPAPTYKEVILQFQSEAERKYEEYERNMMRSNQEITTAQKKHRRLQLQVERLNREILSKRNEVKLLSEKLINRKQDFTARRIKDTLNQKEKKL